MHHKKEYFYLNPSHFKLDGGAMFGIIPRPLWNKVAPADEQNRIDLSLRLFLIKKDKRIVLVDTGIGDYHDAKFNQRFAISSYDSPLINVLKDVGISPDEITDLIISHLHFDHVGGIGTYDEQNTPQPLFKNARLYLHKKHHDYSLSPTQRDSGSFQTKHYLPIVNFYHKQNRITWFDQEEGELIPEFNLHYLCSHGHTPFLLHPYDEQYIYMSDLIPTTNHISIPWVMGYDISPGQTTLDKEKFLNLILKRDLKMIFEHDPNIWGAKIKRNEKGQFIASETYPVKNKLWDYLP